MSNKDINEGISMVRARVLEIFPNYQINSVLRNRIGRIHDLIENKNLRIFIGILELVLLLFSWKTVVVIMLVHFALLWSMKWSKYYLQNKLKIVINDLNALFGMDLTVHDLDSIMNLKPLEDVFDI